MKILTVNTHASQGGAATVAGTIHRFLLGQPESEGISAEMIVGWGKSDPLNHISSVYEGQIAKYSHTIRFRLQGTEGGFLSRKARELVSSRLQEADLVHIHNLHGYYLPLDFLELLEHKPVVWTLHDFWVATGRCAFPLDCTDWQHQCAGCRYRSRYPASIKADYHKNYRIKQQLVSKMKRLTVTVPSRTFYEELTGYGLKVQDVRVVHNGVDTDVFRPLKNESERDELLAEMKIPHDGKPLLCFVANQVANTRKGLQHLVEAMEWLKYPVRFIIIGDKKGAEQLLNNCGRHDVIFTGFLPDKTQVSRWLKISDFFINPSISETFGLTNLESLSCGTRPIVFKLPVFHETLSDWGIFADKIGGRELAEKITASLENKVTTEMRSAAHQYVCDNFSEEPMCRHFISIYKEKIMSARPEP